MSINNKTIGKKKPVKKVAVKKVGTATVNPIVITLNKFKVPAKLWKSFGEIGKKVFNEVYDCTYNQTKQTNFVHPKQPILAMDQWKTLCWNFSCEAAWATKRI